MVYTTNIAQNPGMQLGLSGYAAVNGASISLSPLNTGGTLFGNPGILVQTPGNVSGEGVITVSSLIQLVTNHSFSVYIQGILPGTVTVYAVANPGGVILGSTPVTLTTSYQRVTINNLPVTNGDSLYLIVSTTSAQAAQFWITNVQIEPEPVSHPYCDGGQPGCAWQTAVGGVSFQLYQNTIAATANNVNTAAVVNLLVQGEAFNISAKAVNTNISSIASSSITALGPVGALTDFSVSSLTDPDPAQTYVSWNTAGQAVPTGGTYARNWGVFIPPQDYFVSGGQQLYSRAAFMAVGWQVSAMPNNASAVLTDVQAELLPITTGFGAPSPTAYVLPRAIETIVKPDRLNFCTNPSIDVSTVNWSGIAGGTLSQDTTVFFQSSATFDDQPVTSSNASLKVNVSSSGDGASIVITDLIAGEQYIVSAYVQANSNITDIFMICGNGSTDVVNGNSGTGYSTGGYGAGYYGGNPPGAGTSLYGAGLYGSGLYGVSSVVNSLPTGQWFRIYTTFTATDISMTLNITAQLSSPSNIWVDDVLVELGEVLGSYFDGNYGNNYFWETGGTPGLTRSYYYDEFFVKQQAVTNVLEHHTPLGISFTTPQFAVPYAQ